MCVCLRAVQACEQYNACVCLRAVQA